MDTEKYLNAKMIGPALKKLRESRFPDQVDLAKVTGIKQQTISDTEAGENLPRIPILQAWVEACGSKLSEFFAQFNPEPEEGAASIQVAHRNKELHGQVEELLALDAEVALSLKRVIQALHKENISGANAMTRLNPSDVGSGRRRER